VNDELRLAELVAALSLATDLGMGSPLEQELRSCLVAVRLGEQLGLDEDELTHVYYVALLRWIGCTSHAHELARWFDDEIAAHARSLAWDWGRPATVLGDLLRHAGAGRSALERARTVAGALAGGRGAVGELFRSSCEVGEQLAARLGLEPAVQRSLGQLFERWDGHGWPNGLAGDAIARPVRVVQVAQDAVVLHRLAGADAAVRALRERSGGAYDPDVAASLAGDAERLLGDVPRSAWTSVIEAEPGPRPTLADEALDRALRAIADFADLKSPYTSGHSSGVAELAARAAREARMPDADAADLRRAALVHDLGRTGIPNGIWDRPGPLSDAEWERVRLHPYFVERMLARPAALARIGALAALHHERLDGSGYHRGARAAALPPGARILAAADV
jgi:HD-GYP domain-containing protein (c-di-GMP phosphodiesterase class II)